MSAPNTLNQTRMMYRIAVIFTCCLLIAPTFAQSLRDQAGAARHIQDYVRAEQLFRKALAAQPQFAPLSLDLATVLIDQKKFSEATKHLQRYRSRFGESEAYWLIKGYWYDRQERFFDSLTCYENALRFNSHSEEAMRNYIQTADTLGVPDKAITLARVYPQAINQEGWLRLYSDSAAYAVRLAGMHEPDRKRRIKNVHEAIRRCDKAIKFLYENFPEREAAMQQARMDRMLVWELDNRHQQVLDEFYALQIAHASIRDDVRVAVAQSALNLEKPEQARDILQPLIDKKTTDANARTLMFYAQLEGEDFGAAQKTVDALINDEEPWLYGKSPRVAEENWDRENADYNRMMLTAWGNMLDEAKPNMEAYQAQAPFNADLRSAVGQIYQLRGWPRRAEHWQRSALQIKPDFYSAWSGVIGSRMSVYDFSEAGRITQKLAKDYPDLKSTESLKEDWAIHNMQELSMTFSIGHSTPLDNKNSNTSVNGNRDFEAELWWYSQPISSQQRVFLHTTSSTGSFEEGKGQIDRYGIGWEQRDHTDSDKAYRNTVELNRSYASDVDMGVTLTTEWQLDDNWSVSGAAETFSSQLPVRAYNAGIKAHSLDGAVRYTVDEGEYYSAGLTYVDFSDGNQRWMVGAKGYQVVWSNPHHQWALIESAYSSTNTKNNTIYFNPSNDLDLGLAAEYQGIIRRRYDFEFRHTLLLGVGGYSQQGFGTKPTAQLQYRHNWKRDKALEWFYGVGLNYHPYDGDQELRETLFGGFTWRFD